MTHLQTSKGLLILVILGGVFGLAAGLDPSQHQLIAYALILAGTIYNRLDSRRQGYKFSAGLGAATVTVETHGGRDDHDPIR